MGASPAPWIFAYGSLMFRPGFEWLERSRARVPGYARRFHQGSPDHRGTPEDLGRVVTLVPAAREACEGIVYRVADHTLDDILRALDEREQGGYERAAVEVSLIDDRTLTATTWIAHPHNPYWLGEEPVEAVIARIRRAHGPSGANREYVLHLHAALREEGIVDPHIDDLASRL